MGTIRIGQSGNDTFFYPGIAPVSSGEVKKREYTAEEKEKLVESIKMMPKSKRLSALRSVGLEEEARALAEQMEKEAAKPSVEEVPADDVADAPETTTADGGASSGDVTEVPSAEDEQQTADDVADAPEKKVKRNGKARRYGRR